MTVDGETLEKQDYGDRDSIELACDGFCIMMGEVSELGGLVRVQWRTWEELEIFLAVVFVVAAK